MGKAFKEQTKTIKKQTEAIQDQVEKQVEAIKEHGKQLNLMQMLTKTTHYIKHKKMNFLMSFVMKEWMK